MLRRTAALLAAAALPLAVRPAAAQDGPVSSSCAARPLAVQDACQKSVDLLDYLAPQLGALVAGGNTELGRGGPTGGLGHFSVGLRVNALRSPVPQVQDVGVSVTGPVRSRVGVDGALVAFPVADASVGLFGGIPLGVTSVGGVDLLVNATYLPDIDRDPVTVRTTGGALKLGLGARVGLLRETAFVPGVAVSVLRRALPTTSVTGTTDRGDTFGVADARVRADSWRLTARKNLVIVSLAVGLGQDRYTTRGDVRAAVGSSGVQNFAASLSEIRYAQTLTRQNYFANATLLNLPFVKLVGEIGRTQGGSLPATYNSFDDRRPDQGYTYGSVGVRVGL